MTIDEAMNILYKYHSKWLKLAEKSHSILSTLQTPLEPEDVVQEMYLKILTELKEKKLKPATLFMKGKPINKIIYLRIRNIVVAITRKDENKYIERFSEPINKSILEGELTSKSYAESIYDLFITDNFSKELNKSEAEILEQIDEIIKSFHWYYEKIFKLYVTEYRSIRKISVATSISYKTVWKHIDKCRKEIKKQLYEKNQKI